MIGVVEKSARLRFASCGTLVCGCAVTLLAATTGCAGWSYDRVRLGMTHDQCRRELAEDAFRRTDLGYCYFREQPDRVEAMVILLARDGQVAGKLHARRDKPGGWLQRPGHFRLRGEIDLRRCGLHTTGPIDALRAIADDLLGYRGARPAAQAHAWIAAGIVRLMECWPHVGERAAAYPQLTDTLEQVPGGGTASIRVDRHHVYTLEYVQGTAP